MEPKPTEKTGKQNIQLPEKTGKQNIQLPDELLSEAKEDTVPRRA